MNARDLLHQSIKNSASSKLFSQTFGIQDFYVLKQTIELNLFPIIYFLHNFIFKYI